jgi:predicted MFS family arabinose efflux permease
MTMTTAAPIATTRPALLSRTLLLLFVITFSSSTSFYLLVSVVPMYATTIGVGGAGAGLTTAALMLATILAELVIPRLVARFGYRVVVAVGLVLLGAPAFGLTGSVGLPAILVICLVRGLGFAIMVVVGGALAGSLVPAERRGEGLGLYGLVVGIPAVLALPAGVWLAGAVGYPVVFVTGAVITLVAVAATPGLPGRGPTPEAPVGVLAALRDPGLTRPALVFAATTTAGGIVVSFLPLAVGVPGSLAALALLVHAAAATLTRWWAGRYGDRNGPARLLIPSLVASAAGILALVLTSSPVAVLAGMVLFGAGFGVTQNVTMTLMFSRVPRSGYGTASVVWNLAYDTGYGAGSAGFGVLAGFTGYPAAFAITATLMLTALAPARRDRR